MRGGDYDLMRRDWAGTDGYLLPMKTARDLFNLLVEVDAAMAANAVHFEAKRHFRRIEHDDQSSA